MANNTYVNKVEYGNDTLMDITDTTAEAGDVLEGQVFYAKSGTRSVGTLSDATQSTHGLMSAADKTKLDGIASGAAVTNVQINNTSIVSNGVANISYASSLTAGVVKVASGTGISIYGSGTGPLEGTLKLELSDVTAVKNGNNIRPTSVSNQHLSTFYGLAKIAGADEKDSELEAGIYSNTAKTAIQEMIGAQAAIEVIRL